VLRWLLPLTLLQGLLFFFIVPPWEHYDEPGHFSYAAEIAAGEFVQRGPAAVAISREVADSMVRHGFLDGAYRPSLLEPGMARVGEDQRVHPPLYYAFVAAPLRLVRFLSIDTQLYVARGASLLLYVLTIVAAWRIAVVVAPDDQLLQRLMPVLIVLVPTFADMMTAVNNDVLLNFAATVALLGSLLLIRDGLRPLPVTLALLSLGVAIAAKRTGIAVAIPITLALIWSLNRKPLRPAVVAAGIALVVLFAVAALQPVRISEGGATHWALAPRPWLDAVDKLYLRLDLAGWIRSVSDLERASRPYQALVIVGFTSFWGRLSWGNVALPQYLEWLFVALTASAVVGLLMAIPRWRGVALVRRRSLWLFAAAVLTGLLALAARLHPLPGGDSDAYIPRGRYVFWALAPVLWLLVLGLRQLVPAGWRGALVWGLVAVFALYDLMALVTLLQAFYRG
jgi:hypothetical protein